MSKQHTPHNKKTIDITRLIQLRLDKCYSQNDLARLLREMNEDCSMLPGNISSWESRKRPVPLKYLHCLCDIFSVSEEYLLGEDDIQIDEPVFKPLDTKCLHAYDKQPIYVEFTDYSHQSGWAIYSHAESSFTFLDKKILYIDLQRLKTVLYTFDPNRAIDKTLRPKSITLKELFIAQNVYIMMITQDAEIRNLYNGWYRHNENHSALINSDGLVLPYGGFKKSYNAYTFN